MPPIPLMLLCLAAPASAEDLLSLSFPSPTGGFVQAAALKPTVVVIDLWATWCKPCVGALPKLDALARDLGPRGVVVIAVSQDDDPALVRRFLEEVPLTHLRPVMDVGHRAAATIDPRTLPCTVVLDAAGVVRARFDGYTPGDEVKVRAAVEALLTGPPE
jgi:thiol-disulfide isomerase/thioredoxin